MNNLANNLDVPAVFFAVSDFFEVLELNVTETIELTKYTRIKTKPSQPLSDQSFAQFEAYFKTFYLDHNGNPDSNTLFFNLSDAKAFAIKGLQSKVAAEKSNLNKLQQTLNKLLNS